MKTKSLYRLYKAYLRSIGATVPQSVSAQPTLTLEREVSSDGSLTWIAILAFGESSVRGFDAEDPHGAVDDLVGRLVERVATRLEGK